jgi:hypothetical protein
MARLGLVPGQDFDPGKLDAAAQRALAGAPRAAQALIAGQAEKARVVVNGWSLRAVGAGSYGTDYLKRAAVAAQGPGALRAEDAVFAVAEAGADGQPLDGSRRYTLHFAKGQLPPARASWSITLTDEQRAVTANKLDRHALGSREKLRANKDGSLDLLVQRDPPAKGKEANWLPAPPGRFVLTLAIHSPREKPPSILDGSWKPPAVAPAK